MNRTIYINPYNIFIENISVNYLYDNMYISPYFHKEKKNSLDQTLNNISIESYINYSNNILDNDMLDNLNNSVSIDIKKILEIYGIHFISKNLRDDIFKLCDKIIIRQDNILLYNTNIELNDTYFSKIYNVKYKYMLNKYNNKVSLYKDNVCNNLIEDVIFHQPPAILTDDNIFYTDKNVKKISMDNIKYI